MSMRILVYGAGAIGLYVGGSLAQAGHAVAFVERPAVVEMLRARGLRLDGQEVRPVVLHTSPADALAAGTYDFAIFALKSFDTAAAIADLRTADLPPPPFLCLQNGVDNEPDLAQAFGAERVIAGTVTTAVGKPAVGEVVVERQRGIGVAAGHPLSVQITQALAGAGLAARLYPAAGPMKWSKLLTNLVGNAASALLDMPVAEIFADRRLFALEIDMLRECLRVMRAQRYPVVDLPGTPVRALAFAAERLPLPLAQPLLRRGIGGGRGAKMPSFHIDLHAGRGQTEVRWLNGAVARYGQACGAPAPVNQRLTETLEAVTDGRLSLEAFRRQPEALLQRMRS